MAPFFAILEGMHAHPDRSEPLRETLVRREFAVGAQREKTELFRAEAQRPVSNVPTVWIPGFAETSENFTEHMEAFAHDGRTALSVHCHHGIDTPAREGFPQPQLRKSEALVQTLEAADEEGKVDLVGHSEGAVVACIAALTHPEKVRNVVLLNPAGMMGGDNLLRLGLSWMLEVTQEITRDITTIRNETVRRLQTVCLREAKAYAASGPGHVVRQVAHLSNVDLRPWIRLLQERGIKVSVVMGRHDQIFPARTIKKVAKQIGIPRHRVHAMNGHHNMHIEDPRGAHMLIMRALAEMEAEDNEQSEKRERRSA